MNDLELYNNPIFVNCSRTIYMIETILMEHCGMTQEQARGWIRTWASGAGDGSE